ncbi:MAG: LacI family DNA-binding transcriptional regulator [Anaerolineae bacterium]|nr:LacI family DNA-binding transcriptional regulator [Anaerolineae bacterium]
MAMTLEEVARLSGVSRSTVSRVINDRPGVRPEVRERVWQVIRQCGYQPNLAARTLASYRTEAASQAASTDEPCPPKS